MITLFLKVLSLVLIAVLITGLVFFSNTASGFLKYKDREELKDFIPYNNCFYGAFYEAYLFFIKGDLRIPPTGPLKTIYDENGGKSFSYPI